VGHLIYLHTSLFRQLIQSPTYSAVYPIIVSPKKHIEYKSILTILVSEITSYHNALQLIESLIFILQSGKFKTTMTFLLLAVKLIVSIVQSCFNLYVNLLALCFLQYQNFQPGLQLAVMEIHA